MFLKFKQQIPFHPRSRPRAGIRAMAKENNEVSVYLGAMSTKNLGRQSVSSAIVLDASNALVGSCQFERIRVMDKSRMIGRFTGTYYTNSLRV